MKAYIPSGPYKDNAMILHPNGTGEIVSIKTYAEIKDLLGVNKDDYTEGAQMILFGHNPISFSSIDEDPSGESCTESEKAVVWFIRNTCQRGQLLAPADPMDYDFHRITNPMMVQMFVHETGIAKKLELNRWFLHSNLTRGTNPIFGSCVILGQCCDELPYE